MYSSQRPETLGKSSVPELPEDMHLTSQNSVSCNSGDKFSRGVLSNVRCESAIKKNEGMKKTLTLAFFCHITSGLEHK